MEKIVDFLNANRMGCLASVENGEPRVRPWQFQFVKDGKFCFCTANNKAVYAQLQAKPYAEFTCSSAEFVTVRVRGPVVFRNDREAKQQIIETNPIVKSVYQSADNPAFEVFFIEHGEAVMSDFSGQPPRTISF